MFVLANTVYSFHKNDTQNPELLTGGIRTLKEPLARRTRLCFFEDRQTTKRPLPPHELFLSESENY